MTCYLTIVAYEYECEGGCVEPVGPGLIAMTDEMRNGNPVPICPTCLASLDPQLAVVITNAPSIELSKRAEKR